MEKVVLVDEQDNVLGAMDKLEAHYKGVLHRAFSILIFNSKGELLLQRRSIKKYHSGGLWTNSCCSHPRPDESIEVAANKRLKHEMGIDLQPEFFYKFLYKCKLDNDFTEHELDYVYIGTFDGMPRVNPDEVQDWKLIGMEELRADISKHPENYTVWFRLIMNHPDLKLITT